MLIVLLGITVLKGLSLIISILVNQVLTILDSWRIMKVIA